LGSPSFDQIKEPANRYFCVNAQRPVTAGQIDALGANVDSRLNIGDGVGIPSRARARGVGSYCIHGYENLCGDPQFTGYTRDRGFATSVIANVALQFERAAGTHLDAFFALSSPL